MHIFPHFVCGDGNSCTRSKSDPCRFWDFGCVVGCRGCSVNFEVHFEKKFKIGSFSLFFNFFLIVIWINVCIEILFMNVIDIKK